MVQPSLSMFGNSIELDVRRPPHADAPSGAYSFPSSMLGSAIQVEGTEMTERICSIVREEIQLLHERYRNGSARETQQGVFSRDVVDQNTSSRSTMMGQGASTAGFAGSAVDANGISEQLRQMTLLLMTNVDDKFANLSRQMSGALREILSETLQTTLDEALQKAFEGPLTSALDSMLDNRFGDKNVGCTKFGTSFDESLDQSGCPCLLKEPKSERSDDTSLETQRRPRLPLPNPTESPNTGVMCSGTPVASAVVPEQKASPAVEFALEDEIYDEEPVSVFTPSMLAVDATCALETCHSEVAAKHFGNAIKDLYNQTELFSRKKFLGGPDCLQKDTWTTRLVNNRWFNLCCWLVIILNAAWAAYSTDYIARDAFFRHQIDVEWGLTGLPTASLKEPWQNTSAEAPDGYERYNAVNFIITFWFATEIGVRLCALRCSFFRGRFWRWNVLDVCLVLFSVIDFIISSIVQRSVALSFPNWTFLRVLPLVRILTESVNIGSLSFLRVMFKAVVHSVKLLWCVFFVVLLALYGFGMAIQMGVVYRLVGNDVGSFQEQDLLDLAGSYGSLSITLLSLVMAITGGMDWSHYMNPLRRLPFAYTVLFVFFILFVHLGLLNVVTGTFVECIHTVSQNNRREKVRNQLSKQQEWIGQIRQIFHVADLDKSGTLSWEEFHNHIDHPIIRAYFVSLELDFAEAQGLFTLLDASGNGQIKIEDFVKGCVQLRGEAKSIDLATLRFEFLRFSRRASHFMEHTKRMLADLRHNVDAFAGEADRKSRASRSL